MNGFTVQVVDYTPHMNKPDSGPVFTGSLFAYLGGLFRAHGVEAILVGGYALNANNVQRSTFDIDFMMTAEDFSRLDLFIRSDALELHRKVMDSFEDDAHG